MIRYYLIPFADNPENYNCDGGCCPKYLDILGDACGTIPKEITAIEDKTRKWLRNYYIVAVHREDESQFLELEKFDDVLKLDSVTPIEKLTTLGVDTSKIIAPSYELVDKAVTMWLVEKSYILSDVYGK